MPGVLRDGPSRGEDHARLPGRVNKSFTRSARGMHSDDKEIRVSIAVVTGAGGALGRAVARRLAVDGHAVAVVDIDADAAEATRKDVAAHGGAVRSWILDLRDADAVNEMFNVVGMQSGGTDILVNNAAIYPATPFLAVSPAEYDDVHSVNQRGYWLCAQAAARQMVTTGGGTIVNIASMVTHGGWANLASYAASKGAAVALTRALARELGRPASASTRSLPARSRPPPSGSTRTRPPTTSSSWTTRR